MMCWSLTWFPNLVADHVHFEAHILGYDSIHDLEKKLAGVHAVVPMLSPDVMSASEEMFYRVNDEGMRELVAASVKSETVKTLVYVSSITVTNHMKPSRDMSELNPLPSIKDYTLPYDKSKRLGEDVVLGANSPALATCSIDRVFHTELLGRCFFSYRHFATCSLCRWYISIGSPQDYMFRNLWRKCGVRTRRKGRLHWSSRSFPCFHDGE
jgi:hypothetical protein